MTKPNEIQNIEKKSTKKLSRQLIYVIYPEQHKKYLFKAEEDVLEKDIVICPGKKMGVGIVLEDHLPIDVLDEIILCDRKIEKASKLCASSYDIASSRNVALKSILEAFNTSINELIDTFNNYSNQSEIFDEGLPF